MKKSKNISKKILLLSLGLVMFVGCTKNSSKEIEDTDEKINESKRLIVATYNIDGKEYGKEEEQRKFLEENNVDIAGLQETTEHSMRFSDEGVENYTTLDKFVVDGSFEHSFHGKSMSYSKGNNGESTISKLPLIEKENVIYEASKAQTEEQKAIYKKLNAAYNDYDPKNEETQKLIEEVEEEANKIDVSSQQNYTRVVFEKDEVKISFYNTHLSLNKDIRDKEMIELKEAVDQDKNEYKVVVGDFNAETSTKEFKIIWAEEYNLANGKDGVWLDTWPEFYESMNVQSIDNIIVSKNIEIEDVYMGGGNLSDHQALIAKINLK